MNQIAAAALSVFILLAIGSCSYKVLSECGLGALAYKNPTIAAFTGQCK